MKRIKIEAGQVGSDYAILSGDPDSLDLVASHNFAGALMPGLRVARTSGQLTRAQYKRAKGLIEARMRENMQYDRSQSWPYGTVTLREVRAEIARING